MHRVTHVYFTCSTRALQQSLKCITLSVLIYTGCFKINATTLKAYTLNNFIRKSPVKISY